MNTASHRLSTPLRRTLFILCTGIALVVIAALSGCTGGKTKPLPSHDDPAPNAHCEAMCFEPCTKDDDVGVRWKGDPAKVDDWDRGLQAALEQLTGLARTCETRRAACVKCLRNLDNEGTIDLGPNKEPKP